MPRQSETSNVKKLCGCARARRWTCAHPWYVDYKAPKDHRTRPNERYRKNLDALIARHAPDLRSAQEEAKRAIVAWLDGRDPAELVPGDQPTLAQAIDMFERRAGATAAGKHQVGVITRTTVQGRRFGAWRLEDISSDALEDFRQQRPLVAGNRNLAYLRALCNWAVKKKLLPLKKDDKGQITGGSPFRIANVTVVRLAREEARARRLQPGEEERLLLAASHRIQPLIVAALETGCRLGELLSLQWQQVRFSPRAELFLPAGKTKAKKDRRVPVSSALRTVLDARRHDPAGEPLPPDAYVFGDEIGRRRRSIKTAWRLTCQRAKITGLHFHDLRREAGSRWMDAGVPLATIQRWLGHHNISQTSTYLAASLGGDADEMRAFEQRIGRIPSLPQIDIFSGSTGPERTESGAGVVEQSNKNAVEHDPTSTVH